jgi:23S rRNA pseudouridine1911/1915/1917 synthase
MTDALPRLYADRDIVVVDKPAGLPVAPTRTRGGGPDVVGATGLLLTHRLDAETSGCLVLARTPEGQRRINDLFARGAVRKEYAAVGIGAVPDRGTCELAIGAWRRGRVSIGRGDPARTTWEVLWRDGARIGLLVTPLTGRTHQIRAHMSAVGAPLLGDDTYGGPPADRVYLHAWRIHLPWPRAGDVLTIESPLPAGFGAPSGATKG